MRQRLLLGREFQVWVRKHCKQTALLETKASMSKCHLPCFPIPSISHSSPPSSTKATSSKGTSPRRYERSPSAHDMATHQPLTRFLSHCRVWPCSKRAGKTTCNSSSSSDSSLTGESLWRQRKEVVLDKARAHLLHYQRARSRKSRHSNAYFLAAAGHWTMESFVKPLSPNTDGWLTTTAWTQWSPVARY